MNPGITEGLSTEQLQSFDIDSIENMIKKFKETKELVEKDFDIDNRDSLSKEELKIFNKIQESGKIIEGLGELLQVVKEKSTFISKAKKRISDTIYEANEYRKKQIIEMVQELIKEGNIPDNDTIISILDKIQYIAIGDDDKEIGELINNLKTSNGQNPILQLKATNIIGDFTQLSGISVFNQAQELMINQIFGNNKGFNDKLLMGYNNEKGNFIISIDDFKNEIKTKQITDINSKALGSYLEYLNSKGKLNINTLKKYFGEEKLKELGRMWENNKGETITQKLLKEAGIEEIIEKIYNFNKEDLKIGLEGYNKLNNNYYLLHTNEIINITDINKLNEVLKFIKNNGEDKIKYITFNKYINPTLKNDFNLLKLFYELQNQKLNLLDIKDLDYKKLNYKQIKELYLMININSKTAFIGICSIFKKEEIEKLKNDKEIGKEIINITNIINNTKYNNQWNKYTFNYENIKNLNYENIKNNDKYNDLEKNIIALKDLELINNKEKLNEIDNYFSKNIESNDEIIKFLGDEKNTNISTLLTKTIGKIIITPSITNKIIKNNSIMYTFLPENIKVNFSETYIKGILQNNNGRVIEKEISKVRIKDINQAKSIFTILEKEQNIKLENILKYSEIRSTLSKIIEKAEFNNENMEFINKFSKILKKYKDKINGYMDVYKNSDLNNNQEIKENNSILNKIFNSKNFSVYISKIKNPEIIGPIVGIIRINNGDKWEGEKISTYISNIAENTQNKEEFEIILNDINQIISEAIRDEEKNIKSYKLSEQEIKEIDKIYLKDFSLDPSSINKSFQIFLVNKRSTEKEKFNENNIKNYIKEFLHVKGLDKLNIDLTSFLESKINLSRLRSIINHPESYEIFKSGNQKNIEKLLKNIENNYYNKLEKKVKENKSYKQESIENRDTNNNLNTFITNENNYIQTSKGYILEINGTKIEGISEEEKKLTLGNPEATENLIQFYEFFKELNLESVWKYRKELMLSMGNRNINFVDNDSLSKPELIQFGNNLILSLNNLIENNKELNNKPKLLITNSLSGVQNELRKFSGANSILSDEKTHNNKGEDKFAATLRNFGIIGGAYFKINTFREQIKK